MKDFIYDDYDDDDDDDDDDIIYNYTCSMSHTVKPHVLPPPRITFYNTNKNQYIEIDTTDENEFMATPIVWLMADPSRFGPADFGLDPPDLPDSFFSCCPVGHGRSTTSEPSRMDMTRSTV